MDEAKAVLERLARIDRLRVAGSDARALLPELRQLLVEGKAWLACERGEVDRATSALAALEARLNARRPEVAADGMREEVGARETGMEPLAGSRTEPHRRAAAARRDVAPDRSRRSEVA